MEDWLIVRTAAAESVSQHGTWFFFRFDDVRQPTPTQPFALNEVPCRRNPGLCMRLNRPRRLFKGLRCGATQLPRWV